MDEPDAKFQPIRGRSGPLGSGSGIDPASTADVPPIELVAAKLRDLRATAAILAASPDVITQSDDELRRVCAAYDGWLMVAAGMVDLRLEPIQGDMTGLPEAIRRQIERDIAARGWVLD